MSDSDALRRRILDAHPCPTENGTGAARPIADYLAEQAAIRARWADYCERSRLADLEALESGAESATAGPRDYSHRRFNADLEASEARHFGRLDPRTGAALNTPARLWRWIVHRLRLWSSPAAPDLL